MTKQTTQELQAIVDGAPPLFNTTKFLQTKWGYSVEQNIRSLDDIREILELRKEVESMTRVEARLTLVHNVATKENSELRKEVERLEAALTFKNDYINELLAKTERVVATSKYPRY